MEQPTFRRVVTGTDPDGKAVFVTPRDMELQVGRRPVDGSIWGGFWKVWGSNERVSLPFDGTTYDYDTTFPPPAGFRYEVMHLDAGKDIGTHRSQTVDIGIILSGEIWFEIDGGAEELLRPGDIFIQNGTMHAWHNRSSEPCVLAAVVIGADARPAADA